MAATRRLQGEIDRCLKKVSEGVEQFEDIWKKVRVHNANNTNQKEKYEADLKKEIKKLQRLRDQIKSWLTSAEIKDKSALLENRKLIETQMERFKVVERETKTKAYSKEGLGAAQNKDPAQKEKEELSRWLSDCIDLLSIQIDQFECEIEALLAGGKKKKMDKDKSDRIDELKEWLEKHRFHIKKLEILMRMLNNESIDCDNLRKIKDDVDYYVESNQEPDFVENEGVYDDIEMEDLDYTTPELSNVLNNAAVGADSTETSTPTPSMCGSSPSPASSTNNTQQQPHHHQPTATTATTSGSSSQTPSSTGAPVTPSSSVSAESMKSTGVSSSSNVGSTSSSVHTNHSNSNTDGSSGVTQHGTTEAIVLSNTPNATTNHSSSNSTTINSHHPSERPNKRNNKDDNRGPVKPTVVRPNQNSTIIGKSGSHTPTKGSNQASSAVISGSSNSSTTTTAMSYLAASQQQQHNAKNASKKDGVEQQQQQNNHAGLTNNSTSTTNNNSLPTANIIANHVSQQQQFTTQQMVQQQQLATPNGPLLHGTQLHLHNKNSPDINTTNSLKHIAQKKLNEVASHQNQGNSPVTGNVVPSVGGNGLSTSIANSSSIVPPPTSSINSSAAGVSMSISSAATLSSSSSTPSSSTTSATAIVAPPATGEAHVPPLLGAAPLGRIPLNAEHEMQFKRLQAAYYHMPHPSDSERLRVHFPRQPVVTPSHYPQAPPPLSDTVDFFQRLSTETLFFIFYYLEGTKAQYLAAKALKKQSWRFHTKYMMWFQRHEEPKAITDEYEQGTYIFFDYDNWGQRKKENFTFEYRYLEDRDLN